MSSTRVLVGLVPVLFVWIAIHGVSNVGGQTFTCPQNSTGHCQDGPFGNPYNCSTYWSCINCQEALQFCPTPLEWSDAIKACVAAQDSGCTEIPPPTSTTTTTTTTTTGPSSTTPSGPPPSTTTTAPPTTTTNTVPAPSTTLPTGSVPIAMTFARTTDELDPRDPLPFPEMIVDVGDGWDRITNTLTVPRNSVYFFHLNAGAKSGNRVNLSLRGSYNIDIFRNSTSHTGTDTLSRDIIQPVSAGATIKVVNEYTGELFSDSGRQTSFTAFDLQSFLWSGDREIFSVARQSGYDGNGEVPFDNVLVDTEANWSTSRYTIATSGLYFFTLSCGVKAGGGIRAQIKSASEGVLTEIWRASSTHNAEDTMSTVMMGSLTAGDYVYVNFISGSIYSDSERQTSFGGFHYHPEVASQTAWSVYRTGSATTGSDPIDPLSFQGSEVNTGLFSFADHHVHITQSGLYYVHLSVGVQTGASLEAFIVRDLTKTEAEISRSSTHHNGPDMMSQGLLLELSAGNTLKVVLGASSGLYSDTDKQTTFTGILLYPYPD